MKSLSQNATNTFIKWLSLILTSCDTVVKNSNDDEEDVKPSENDQQ